MLNEIEVRYEKAVEQAREAIEELRLAALAKGYEEAKRDLQAVVPTPKLTPINEQELREKPAQERRDEIIETAKRDVAEIIGKYGEIYMTIGGYENQCIKPKFIVNKDKRAVTVLLYGAFSKNLYAKGIAKCTPSDCFNAHIGKAIALRRALGLEVPSEYLNAPQPTEVRVGDVVNLTPYGDRRIKVTDEYVGGRYTVMLENIKRMYMDAYTVIDDSRDGDAK